MNWLSQNWLWILLAIGVVFMMRRGGMGCGMGHAHHGPQEGNKSSGGTTERPAEPKEARGEDAGSHRHRGC